MPLQPCFSGCWPKVAEALPTKKQPKCRSGFVVLKDTSDKGNNDLIERMFATGLTKPLIDALGKIGRCIPVLLPLIQARLIAEFSIILARESTVYQAVVLMMECFRLRKGAKADNNSTAGGNTEKEKKSKLKISTPREALKKGRKQLVNAVIGKKRSFRKGVADGSDTEPSQIFAH